MRLIELLLLCLVVGFFCTADGARKKSSSSTSSLSSSSSSSDRDQNAEGLDRVQGIHDFIYEKETFIIPTNDRNFTKFVSIQPRFYQAALFMTAAGSNYNCMPCKSALAAYEEMAFHYNSQYDFLITPMEHRMAFFVVDVDKARQAFKDMDLETVPRVFVLPAVSTDDGTYFNVKKNAKEMNTHALLDTMSVLLKELENVSGVKVEPKVSPFPAVFGLSIFAMLLAFMLSYVDDDDSTLYDIVRSPNLWMTFTIMAFSFGVSGSVYCIIRSSPLYSVGRDGSFSIFSTGGRDQTVLEGVVVALYTLGCSLGIYAMYFMSSFSMPMPKGKCNFIPAFIPGAIRSVLVCAAAAFVILCADLLFRLYVSKTAWYHVKETIPPYLWTFYSSPLKKTSGLVKRLMRVTYIFVFEFVDWPSFRKTLQSYIGNYLLRSIGLAT